MVKNGRRVKTALSVTIQMNNYNVLKSPYNFPYSDEFHQNPQAWWLGCRQSSNYLQQLALYIFFIVPHSASCERVFSILNWFTQKRRSRYA